MSVNGPIVLNSRVQVSTSPNESSRSALALFLEAIENCDALVVENSAVQSIAVASSGSSMDSVVGIDARLVGHRDRRDGTLSQLWHLTATCADSAQLHGDLVLAIPENEASYGVGFARTAWLRQLAAHLGEDEEFCVATNSYDGSIALGFGDEYVGLRIYRGRVIDQGASVASAATFTVHAPNVVWLDLAARPRNEYVVFAMKQRFNVSGSMYEYLRMNRAVLRAVDVVREKLLEEMRVTNHA